MGIFDIMLPSKNGYELTGKIKQNHSVLPFFLSAKSLKVDKLNDFKFEASDKITKLTDEEFCF